MDGAYSFLATLNVISVLYFVFFVASLVMGVFVFSKNQATRTALLFLLLSIAFSCLHLGEIFFSWSDSKIDAFGFTAVKSIGFVFWWPLSVHFFLTLRFPKIPRRWVAFLIPLYGYSLACVAGFFLGINHAADYIRQGIIWIDVPYWSPLALPYLLMMPVCLSVNIGQLLSLRRRAQRDANALLLRQVNIMLFSGIPFALTGLIINILLPNLGITVPSVGHLFIGLWILCVGYAIVRYRFLVPTLEFAAKQVFTIAGEIILITDLQWRVTEFNQTFTVRLGYSPGEQLTMFDLIDLPDAEERLTRENAENDALWTLRAKDGSPFYVKKKGAVLFDNGTAIGIVFILSDVSELRNQNLLLESKVRDRTKELREAKEEAEKRLRITEVYTRRSVVEFIQKGGDPRLFTPVSREFSVLFADIRDFTGLSENATPLETVTLLNEYFDEMNGCVLRNNGEIDKLIGDCIMALFTDVASSVKAAIDMRRLLAQFNEGRPGRARVNNGVGINYGKVIVGNIGSPGKMDYTVIGDIVNSASRIESLTKYYGLPVLISEDVYQALPEGFSVRFVDQVLVKGRKTPIRLYEVFDHETEEVKRLKTSLEAEYVRLFDLYQRGEFVAAQEGYRSLRTRLGDHHHLEGRCKDPLVDFCIDRCQALEEKRKAGLLGPWNGVYEFMEKETSPFSSGPDFCYPTAMYKPVDPKVNFPAMEEAVLAFWEKERIFHRSLEQRRGAEEFVFYDGPPFATGLPHFGHFVPGTIKDIVPRFQTMKGKLVERRFGWDCHGLPVENLVEKELGLNSKTDIERFGVANFNEACRSSVLRYTKEWRTIMTRAGRWVDFDDDYKTMDVDFMESIWWVQKTLYDKGLMYEGRKIMPYCPRCSTVLSTHELNLGGYKDVHDPAVTVKFALKDEPTTAFLAWTTTPWTLPSNLALSLGPDIDYVKIEDGAECFILAASRVAGYYKDPSAVKVLWTKKGSELGGIEYLPLFPYFAETRAQGSFRTVVGTHVTDGDGTGIVHTAPGFGEDDYNVLKGTGVPTVCPIDAECKFTAEVTDYQGRFVKDCDKDIIDRLKAEGKLVKRDQILHSYPHCWRCSSPLIYRAISSWFVKVEDIKPSMLANNNTVKWVPDHIQQGRFGKWLEGARDWAISRNRYWGNPLPIWRCDHEGCAEEVCVGSRAELGALSGTTPDDLHKHFVDQISWKCSCGKGTMRRIPEVLDCWFESGAMPYGQVHYPFENKQWFDTHFPADFITEGLDQTRGWFYTLTILAAALFDRPAFQNCVVSGIVLATDGRKMSKSLRNYTNPAEVMERYGADALRLYLMLSPLTKADDLKYSDEGVQAVLRDILIPLWNAYSFYVTYANLDGASPQGSVRKPTNPLDGWILSELEAATVAVTTDLEGYEVSRAIGHLVNFLDLLNNWYIRRSRRRFWKGENDLDKNEAYDTLYQVLKRFATLAAPFVPFIADELWSNLKLDSDPLSVHLADWPVADPSRRRPDLEAKMAGARKAVALGRAVRNTHNLKNRQPLKSVYLVTKDPAEKAVLREMEDLIREELNVKEVLFQDNEEALVEYGAKANFKVLGKVLGAQMKVAAARIEALSPAEIATIVDGNSLHLEIAGVPVELNTESVLVTRKERASLKVLNEGSLTVALDGEVTRELKLEGHLRDVVRAVQSARKEADFAVSDRIRLVFGGSPVVKEVLADHGDELRQETLAIEATWNEDLKARAGVKDGDTGDEAFVFTLTKV